MKTTERVFECDRDGAVDVAIAVRDLVRDAINDNQSARVTVRVEVGEEAAVEAEDDVIVREGELDIFSVGGFNWLSKRPDDPPPGKYKIRAEYRRIPDKPARVPWPDWLPDVTRCKLGPMVGAEGNRQVQIWTKHWAIIDWAHRQEFGTWPANESRIAENDNGYVKLSEVPNGE